jgi:Holliday junction resolvasome RuvABC endonuclease subunit|tara:strand:+ start:1054 stop:1557 length:504 start_codon:yes stop_codon:yes gene_type:complete
VKILGLDASTTTVGYAFVENKKVIDMGFIPINKEKTIRDKVQVTLDEINKLDPFDEIDKIYIEDSLSGFMRGRTSQQTIIKLAKFNAVLTYCLEFAYGEIVDGINPMTARKHLFGKSRVKGVSAKDFVKKEINCLYSLEEYVKLTKTGLWDKRNMDAYDALVCALYE